MTQVTQSDGDRLAIMNRAASCVSVLLLPVLLTIYNAEGHGTICDKKVGRVCTCIHNCSVPANWQTLKFFFGNGESAAWRADHKHRHLAKKEEKGSYEYVRILRTVQFIAPVGGATAGTIAAQKQHRRFLPCGRRPAAL